MGAVAVTSRKEAGRLDNRRVVEANVTLSASYATGGDTLAPSAFGLRHITQLIESSHDANGSARPVGGPATTAVNRQSGMSIALGGTSGSPLVLAYDAQGAQIANATNLSARGPFRVRVVGY